MQTHILIRDGGWCTRRRQRQRLYTCFIHLSCRSCLQFYVGEGLGSHFYSFMSTAISESLIAFLQLSLADCRSSLCSQKHIYCAFAVLVIQPNEMVFFSNRTNASENARGDQTHVHTHQYAKLRAYIVDSAKGWRMFMYVRVWGRFNHGHCLVFPRGHRRRTCVRDQ